MSQDITPYENKSFRELIQELRKTTIKARDLMGLVIRQGQKEGFSNEQIKEEIQNVIPYSTMIHYLPEYMTRPYNRYSDEKSITKTFLRKRPIISQNARLVIEDEQPKIPVPEPVIIESEPEGEIIKIEMDWGHCNFFCNWFKNELKQHQEKKDGKYIIEYNLLTKEISVDIEHEAKRQT